MLWPHAQTRRAVASLRSTMWRLRPVGADPLLEVDPQYIELAPGVSVDWHDAVDQIGLLLDDGEPAPVVDPQFVAELLPLLRAGELLDGWAEPWAADRAPTVSGVAQGRTRRVGPRPRKAGSQLLVWLHALATYASFRQKDHEGLERAMNALLMICMSVGTPLAALGLYDLQVRLERWDYNRHAAGLTRRVVVRITPTECARRSIWQSDCARGAFDTSAKIAA